MAAGLMALCTACDMARSCAPHLRACHVVHVVPLQASRVLRPGGVCILAFGPDCFREKAWAGWLSRSMAERTTLLQR